MTFFYFWRMIVTIDPEAGPCFGVRKAIEQAEEILDKSSVLYCLGDLIHNDEELNRLKNRGMKIIAPAELSSQKPQMVLLRAHGERPETYATLNNLNINIADSTCPIVKKLQTQIAETYLITRVNGGQIAIFGDPNHAEIMGLQGHCQNSAIILQSADDIRKLNPRKTIYLFSQTTKYRSHYHSIRKSMEEYLVGQGVNPQTNLVFFDSSCKIVADRDKQLQKFVVQKDLILFVSGVKSSNGHQLFNLCQSLVTESYFISNEKEIEKEWLVNKNNIGITGATSTPLWLLEKVHNQVISLTNPQEAEDH